MSEYLLGGKKKKKKKVRGEYQKPGLSGKAKWKWGEKQ